MASYVIHTYWHIIIAQESKQPRRLTHDELEEKAHEGAELLMQAVGRFNLKYPYSSISEPLNLEDEAVHDLFINAVSLFLLERYVLVPPESTDDE